MKTTPDRLSSGIAARMEEKGDSMKRLARIFVCILFFLPATAAGADFDYTHYETVLKRYLKTGVKIDGIPVNAVDYASLSAEAKRPGSDYQLLLKELAAFNQETMKSREEKIAFWINVYNIGAIKTILDFYPVDSIRSRRINLFGSPWGREVITVGGREYSLGEIENDILLERFKDLRIHFGINCASVSCVNLSLEPYRADSLFKQLEEQGRHFLAGKEKGMFIDRNRNIVYLSQIFKFDKRHFDEIGGGALNFILPYVPPDALETLKKGKFNMEYLDYNWNANDSKNAGHNGGRG